jgi:hypothetical protein
MECGADPLSTYYRRTAVRFVRSPGTGPYTARVPRTNDEDRTPPPPEAWEQAPRLETVPAPAEPALISDGGGLPFEPARVIGSPVSLDPADPAVAALLTQIDRGRQQAQPTRLLRPKAKPAPMAIAEKLAGWRELARTDDEVLFGRGMPPQLLTVAAKRGLRNRWSPLGASNARALRAVRDGIRASSWRLDPSFEPGGDQQELRILVTERTMASGTPAAARLLSPDLHLGADRVVLRVYVRPIEGYVGRAGKPGKHETPVIVRLPEPLGNRQLLDGALYEPPAER